MNQTATTRTTPPLHAVIRERRRAAGLTQKDLAERMHCPRSYVNKVERGLSEPRLASLESFARALGTTPWRMLREAYKLRYPLL